MWKLYLSLSPTIRGSRFNYIYLLYASIYYALRKYAYVYLQQMTHTRTATHTYTDTYISLTLMYVYTCTLQSSLPFYRFMEANSYMAI